MEHVGTILARLFRTRPDGLQVAKTLSQRGMEECEKDLTLDTMYDKVCSITDDKEQERNADFDFYATQKELPF